MHSQFLGWPGPLPHPVNKQGSVGFMKQLAPEPVSCAIKIEREGIRVLEDVALTQFIVTVDRADSAKPQSSRIIHTWAKEEGHWRVLGGSSAII